MVLVDVHSVSGSCGYSVPEMEFVRDRERLADWAADKTEADLDAYRTLKNATSRDGLPTWLVPATEPVEARS